MLNLKILFSDLYILQLFVQYSYKDFILLYQSMLSALNICDGIHFLILFSRKKNIFLNK